MTEETTAEPQTHPITGSWRVVGAAETGLSHLKAGLPCQDAQDSRVLPGGVLLVALADGAGSASRSDEGARAAVQAALDSLEATLADRLRNETLEPKEPANDFSLELEFWIRDAFAEARMALVDLALESGESLREYATTLTCVAAGDNWLAAGQLGDGVIVASFGAERAGTTSETPASELAAVIQPQRGEYANETYFLTQAEALEQVQVEVSQQAPSALAVMSDGLTRLALRLPGGEPHPPFFQPLLAFAAAASDPSQAAVDLASFLASERVCARTDDDKALVIALRR